MAILVTNVVPNTTPTPAEAGVGSKFDPDNSFWGELSLAMEDATNVKQAPDKVSLSNTNPTNDSEPNPVSSTLTGQNLPLQPLLSPPYAAKIAASSDALVNASALPIAAEESLKPTLIDLMPEADRSPDGVQGALYEKSKHAIDANAAFLAPSVSTGQEFPTNSTTPKTPTTSHLVPTNAPSGSALQRPAPTKDIASSDASKLAVLPTPEASIAHDSFEQSNASAARVADTKTKSMQLPEAEAVANEGEQSLVKLEGVEAQTPRTLQSVVVDPAQSRDGEKATTHPAGEVTGRSAAIGIKTLEAFQSPQAIGNLSGDDTKRPKIADLSPGDQRQPTLPSHSKALGVAAASSAVRSIEPTNTPTSPTDSSSNTAASQATLNAGLAAQNGSSVSVRLGSDALKSSVGNETTPAALSTSPQVTQNSNAKTASNAPADSLNLSQSGSKSERPTAESTPPNAISGADPKSSVLAQTPANPSPSVEEVKEASRNPGESSASTFGTETRAVGGGRDQFQFSEPTFLRLPPHAARLDQGPVQAEILRFSQQGGGEIEVELTPPDQTKFKITLKLDGRGDATLIVEGGSESTRTRLEQSAQGLRDQFAQMGLQLNMNMHAQNRSASQDTNANSSGTPTNPSNTKVSLGTTETIAAPHQSGAKQHLISIYA